MTDTLTTFTPTPVEAEAGPGCGSGCCKPPEPVAVEDQIAELQARRETVERRLRGLQEA